MPLDIFKICLDNKTQTYSPGDIVSGHVLIQSNAETCTPGIKLKFHGIASVQWSESHTETTGFGDDKKETTTTINYSNSETLFNFKNYLLGDWVREVKIPAGESSYPFSFQLPSTNLPASFVGSYGSVEYTLEANVRRTQAFRFDYRTKQKISIVPVVDLTKNFEASQTSSSAATKKFCCLCCKSGPLSMNVSLSRKGYCPGEIIHFDVEVNNMSRKGVNKISAGIGQNSVFHARGKSKENYCPVAVTKSDIRVSAGESEIWSGQLKVPRIPPSHLGGGCTCIDVTYALCIKAQVPAPAFDLYCICPIIIGTVPVQGKSAQE